MIGVSRPLAAPQASPDACTLLTEAQIDAVLGVKVGKGGHVPATTTAICGWTQPDSPNTGKRVLLSVMTQLGRSSPVDRFNTGKTPVPGVPKEPVTGIGDEAYYSTTPGIGVGLSVRKGSQAFQVRVYGFPPDEAKAKEKTLALEVIAKL
jgi:hypothetical protein